MEKFSIKEKKQQIVDWIEKKKKKRELNKKAADILKGIAKTKTLIKKSSYDPVVECYWQGVRDDLYNT